MPRVIAIPSDESLAEARGELIPEGDYYDVLIEKVEEGQTKKTGDDMYILSLKILDPGPAQNRKLRTWVVLAFPGFSLKQLNKSIGLPVTTDDGLYAGDPHEYTGQHTAIKVIHEDYNDEPTAGVKRFIVQKGADPKPKVASGRTSLPRRGAPAKPPVESVPDPEPTPAS